MRWFKHLTDTRQDEKVARLIAEGGHAAYGLWWMVLETIARQMENGTDKCSVTYPLSKWAAELQTTPCNVRKRLAALVAAGLLEMSCNNAGIELQAPNLLKYRDEWQAKLGSRYRARIQNQTQKQNQTSACGKTEEPVSKEEQAQIADRVFAQLEETPEGAAVVRAVLGCRGTAKRPDALPQMPQAPHASFMDDPKLKAIADKIKANASLGPAPFLAGEG